MVGLDAVVFFLRSVVDDKPWMFFGALIWRYRKTHVIHGFSRNSWMENQTLDISMELIFGQNEAQKAGHILDSEMDPFCQVKTPNSATLFF